MLTFETSIRTIMTTTRGTLRCAPSGSASAICLVSLTVLLLGRQGGRLLSAGRLWTMPGSCQFLLDHDAKVYAVKGPLATLDISF
jgi:hypothetical protein